MRLAIAGKGGAGKTTLAATLARVLARSGRRVLAIDGDPNPNLGVALGIDPAKLDDAPRVPNDCVVDVYDDDGRQHMKLRRPLEELRAEYGIDAPDKVRLMLVGSVGHAGQG